MPIPMDVSISAIILTRSASTVASMVMVWHIYCVVCVVCECERKREERGIVRGRERKDSCCVVSVCVCVCCECEEEEESTISDSVVWLFFFVVKFCREVIN